MLSDVVWTFHMLRIDFVRPLFFPPVCKQSIGEPLSSCNPLQSLRKDLREFRIEQVMIISRCNHRDAPKYRPIVGIEPETPASLHGRDGAASTLCHAGQYLGMRLELYFSDRALG